VSGMTSADLRAAASTRRLAVVTAVALGILLVGAIGVGALASGGTAP
jgi:hypothetical protein